MRNVPNICIRESNDSVIRFEERRSVIRFVNTNRLMYKRVQVDGCAIIDGVKCDNMLCSLDEHEEYYVELKGGDVLHAIEQISATIVQLGEYSCNRHSFIVCTKVAPHLTTKIQKAKVDFKRRFQSDLVVRESPMIVKL